MKKFIVIYHASESVAKKMADPESEDMKAGMKPWMDWAQRCGPGLIDLGAPLSNGQKVTKKGTLPSNKDVVGYSILQAENMEKAVAMLKGHPHIEWTEGCEIEVHEAMPLPGM